MVRVADDALCDDKAGCAGQIHFTAAPGEANAVTVESPPGGGAVIRDDGATLTVGTGCVSEDVHQARCSDPQCPVCAIHFSSVDTGDRDDKVDVRSGVATVHAGLGDDDVALAGGSADGGGGRDRLSAGYVSGFPTILSDGDVGSRDRPFDSDVFAATRCAPTGPDVSAAGALGLGVTVSYVKRTSPVTVDLSTGTAGQRGEHDRLEGCITNANGGSGPDRLIGNRDPNTLWGGPGNDSLVGGGGSDNLIGQEGADRLSGGSGDDELWAPDGDPSGIPFDDDRARDIIRCGPGQDLADYVRSDWIAADCETVALTWKAGDGNLEEFGRALSLHLPLRSLHQPITRLFAPCRGRQAGALVARTTRALGVAGAGALIASGPCRVPNGGRTRGEMILRPNRLGRRLLARRHRLDVVIFARIRGREKAKFFTTLTVD
jgi:hypothetical protein